jgi:hypothetical protein
MYFGYKHNSITGSIFFILFVLTLHMEGQTIIPGGYVSGNWEVENSPYIIQDDILIHPDSTLVIGPGISVLFSGPFMLEVQGQLLVTGTPSQPVIFDRENDTIAWHGIYFNTTDTSITDSSILEHGAISHCYQRPCLEINHSSRLRVSGFTIQYGESFRGAGISCSHSSPFFEGLLMQLNHSLDGAGISLENSSPVLKNCTIMQNAADGAGGGMTIFDTGSPYLENCTISGNQSFGSGGGIYINDADPVFVRCQFLENEGAIGGGNLYSGGGVSVKLGANPYFENCIFENNYSHREGGGISTFSPTALVSCLFASNSSGTFGGGAFISSGNLIASQFTNCTFSDNDGPQGMALATHNHTAVLRNCILWHANPSNPGSLVHLDAPFSWNVLDVSYSDLQNGQAGIENSGTAQFTWGPGNIDLDPGFLPGSMELSWQSPCIEAGTPDTTGLGLPELDLAGNMRLVNQKVDMGANEYQFPVTIQNSKLKIQNSILVYPNPARQYIFIMLREMSESTEFHILNSEGHLMEKGEFTAGNEVIMIDLHDYAPGLYLIELWGKNFHFSKKIVCTD